MIDKGASANAPRWNSHAPTATIQPIANHRDRNRSTPLRWGWRARTGGAATAPRALSKNDAFVPSADATTRIKPKNTFPYKFNGPIVQCSARQLSLRAGWRRVRLPRSRLSLKPAISLTRDHRMSEPTPFKGVHGDRVLRPAKKRRYTRPLRVERVLGR